MNKIKGLALAAAGFLLFSLFTNVNIKTVSAQEFTKVKEQEQNYTKNNKSFETAQKINFGSECTGEITEEDNLKYLTYYYKFEVKKPGRVDLNIHDHWDTMETFLYNKNLDVIYGSQSQSAKEKDKKTDYLDKETFYLDKGIYYIEVTRYHDLGFWGYGKYSFKLDYTEVDSNQMSNNSPDNPQKIELGKSYTGMVTTRTAKDDNAGSYSYTFDIKKPQYVHLNFKINNETMEYELLDNKSKEIKNISHWETSKTEYHKVSDKIYLNPGKYYLVINPYAHFYTGIYNFSIDGRIYAYKNNIETPKNNATISGKTTIKGWYIYGSKINKLELLVDGKVKGQALRSRRNDVSKVFKDYDGSNAGFSYVLNTKIISDGKHKIQIKATGADGTTNYSEVRNVNVKNKVEPYKSNIETPKYNSVNKGKVAIKGWYIYGKPIKKIDVIVEGKYYGWAPRCRRNDVGNLFKGYDVSNAGFSFTLNLSKFKKGSHKIEIKAIGTDGTSHSTFRTIKVA